MFKSAKYLIVLLVFSSQFSVAQDSLDLQFAEKAEGKLPIIGLQVGLLNYKGEVGEIDKIGALDNLTLGYQLNLNYVFWDVLGAELYGGFGNILQSQKSTDLIHNFKTLILNGGVNVAFKLDNGFILPKHARIAPFLFGGVSLLNYYPYGDFKDKNGDNYYYWSDGSIRNLAERDPNADQAVITERDFEFETSYRGLNGGFPLFTMSYNVGLASEFKINKWLSSELRLCYSFTATDQLDGLATDGKNDRYINASFGICVNPNFIKKSQKKEEEVPIDINFKELLTMDSDGDGVADLNDKCGGTPAKTPVNGMGCPTKEVSDSLKNKTAAELGDSLVLLHKDLCISFPSLCNSDETDEINGIQRNKTTKQKNAGKEDRPIEVIVSIADKNQDGKLILAEIYDAIEKYLEGTIDLSLPELKKLIDSFFDQ